MLPTERSTAAGESSGSTVGISASELGSDSGRSFVVDTVKGDDAGRTDIDLQKEVVIDPDIAIGSIDTTSVDIDLTLDNDENVLVVGEGMTEANVGVTSVRNASTSTDSNVAEGVLRADEQSVTISPTMGRPESADGSTTFDKTGNPVEKSFPITGRVLGSSRENVAKSDIVLGSHERNVSGKDTALIKPDERATPDASRVFHSKKDNVAISGGGVESGEKSVSGVKTATASTDQKRIPTARKTLESNCEKVAISDKAKAFTLDKKNSAITDKSFELVKDNADNDNTSTAASSSNQLRKPLKSIPSGFLSTSPPGDSDVHNDRGAPIQDDGVKHFVEEHELPDDVSSDVELKVNNGAESESPASHASSSSSSSSAELIDIGVIEESASSDVTVITDAQIVASPAGGPNSVADEQFIESGHKIKDDVSSSALIRTRTGTELSDTSETMNQDSSLSRADSTTRMAKVRMTVRQWAGRAVSWMKRFMGF